MIVEIGTTLEVLLKRDSI